MKNRITLTIIGLAIICSYSFTPLKNGNEEFSTSYSFVRSGESNPLIHLQLNEDNTFTFIDNSNPDKLKYAEGKYEINGRTIRLFNYNSTHPISRFWKKDNKCNCIKSRQGMEWTRICGTVK